MPWFLRPRRLIAAAALATVAFTVWSMSVPNLLGSPLDANEYAAMATLRNIRAAEQQFMAVAAVDRDGDGRGEAGFFEELAGAVPRRQAASGTKKPSVPVLSQAFGEVERGRVHRSGYFFQLYLPTADGRWVGNRQQAGEVGIDASEGAFCIYAWPDDASRRRRAFFTDANGDTLACSNTGWRYCGLERPVHVDAALPASAVGEGMEGGRMGRDGQIWLVVQ